MIESNQTFSRALKPQWEKTLEWEATLHRNNSFIRRLHQIPSIMSKPTSRWMQKRLVQSKEIWSQTSIKQTLNQMLTTTLAVRKKSITVREGSSVGMQRLKITLCWPHRTRIPRWRRRLTRSRTMPGQRTEICGLKSQKPSLLSQISQLQFRL